MIRRQLASWELPPLLKVGDTVTSPSWEGETAKITELSPYRHLDGSDGTCAILNNGGFWPLSKLLRVEERRFRTAPQRYDVGGDAAVKAKECK